MHKLCFPLDPFLICIRPLILLPMFRRKWEVLLGYMRCTIWMHGCNDIMPRCPILISLNICFFVKEKIMHHPCYCHNPCPNCYVVVMHYINAGSNKKCIFYLFYSLSNRFSEFPNLNYGILVCLKYNRYSSSIRFSMFASFSFHIRSLFRK